MSMCRVFSCWKRVFALASVFSRQNSVSLCPTPFCTLRPNLPVTPGISWLSTFAFQTGCWRLYSVSPSKQVRFASSEHLTTWQNPIHSSLLFRIRPFIWPDPDAEPPAPRRNSLPQSLCPHTTVSHLSCIFVPIFAAQTSNWMPNKECILSVVNSEPGWF